MKRTQILAALFSLLAVQGLSAPQSAGTKKQQTGAKALFYSPETAVDPSQDAEEADNRPVGIRYWIELEGVGAVTAERDFHTDERIRLSILSNTDGYLFLWSLDQTGHGHLIFPPENLESGKNFVTADSEYVTPGWITFKPPVEDERLLIYFTRLESDASDPDTTLRTASQPSNQGSRSLVFEIEEQDEAEVGTYIVNKDGGPVAAEVRLKHRER